MNLNDLDWAFYVIVFLFLVKLNFNIYLYGQRHDSYGERNHTSNTFDEVM